MTEPNENIAPGRGTATRTSESDEGKASGRGIMSLETVRRLAWTAIVLFVMALVFAFNRGPILAWLAANHTPAARRNPSVAVVACRVPAHRPWIAVLAGHRG